LIIGSAVGLLASNLHSPTYTASTQLFVSTPDSRTLSDLTTGSQFSEERVASYAELIAGPELARRVIDRLHLSMSPQELSGEITAAPVNSTVLIDVAVTDSSPQRAQQIAAAIDSEFPTYAAELETADSGTPSPVKVTVTAAPDLPALPSTARARDLLIGVLLGAVAGIALAVARTRLDRSVKNADQAAEAADTPALGAILQDDALREHHTVERSATGQTAESYRQLRTNLQFMNVDDPPKVIMISSAMPSEGKTTLAINLGIMLADAGQQVTLLEANLRKPKVGEYLRLAPGVGLTDVLAGAVDVEDVMQIYRQGLNVITAGETPSHPGDLLASTQMAVLVEKLRGRNDFVLIDAPALLPVADALALSVRTDGVLISVRYGRTSKDQLRSAAVRLQQVRATTLGVVLNMVPPKAEPGIAPNFGFAVRPRTGRHGIL